MRGLAVTLALFPAFAIASPVLTLHPPWADATRTDRPLRGTPEEAARKVALAHAKELGLAGAALGEAHVIATSLGHVVRFATERSGKPILGAVVTVSLDPRNGVRRMQSSCAPIFSESQTRRLSPGDAMERAAEGVDGVFVDGGRVVGEHREVFFVEQGIARLAYEVHLATLNPLQNLYAVVDAASGEVRSLANRVAHSDDAKIYSPSPGKDGTSPLSTVTVRNLATPRDPDGYLKGTLTEAFTCCLHEGCDPQKPAKQIVGNIKYSGFSVPLTAEFCDVLPQASNSKNGRTSYDYSTGAATQSDPPTKPDGTDPADEDVFSEVHGYQHVNIAYDYFRTLSPSFLLRDQRKDPKKRLKIWTNVLTPNYPNAQIGMGGVNIKGFTRVDNAAYIPRETWQQLTGGATTNFQFPDTDAILLFQGTKADFGYDGDVVYHELTHGVIFATAAFQGLQVDKFGALNEGGAMHEGFADYFAAAITDDPKVGDYIGPRIKKDPSAPPAEGALRNLENSLKCPDLIVGEVHIDSEHFSAALWASRKKLQGTDKGATFDKAVFDALVSLVPSAGFKAAAEAVAESAKTLFPALATARDDVLAEFKSRGVTDCEKLLSYSTPRKFYVVEGTGQGVKPFVPGPIQFRIKAPRGAQQLSLTATRPPSANPLNNVPPNAVVAVSVGKPIAISGSPGSLAHDAQVTKAVTAGNDSATAEVPIFADCNQEVFVTVLNQSSGTLTLVDVALNLKPLAACVGPDAGPDAAAPAGPDSGAVAAADAGPVVDAVNPEKKCGCNSGGASLAGVSAIAVGAVLRRRRRGAR